jgi:hypothetical protein
VILPPFARRTAVGLLVSLAGCSGGHSLDDGAPLEDGAGKPCDPGTMRACGLELGTQGGFVECASGNQFCEAGRWGSCLLDATKGTTRVKAPAPSAGLPDLSSRSKVLAIGGSSTKCTDNPCNPYCQVFSDVPDAAIQADGTTITLEASPGPSLANSNVPNGIGNKGDDPNGVCTPGCTSQACKQACQYDMKCDPTTAGTCAPYKVGESGSCAGIDITAPTTCSVPNGRNVTVCNRGTVKAPAGIQCYLFPGNSQHMPEATPDISTATKIMTTLGEIAPGYCETQTLDDKLFDSNGTEELICNPNGITLTSTSVSGFPSTQQSLPAYAGWTTPEAAYGADDVYATASPGNAGGAQSAGPLFPSSNAAVGMTETWTNPTNVYADDGQSMTASPSTTATTYATSKTPTADDGSLGSDAYLNDGNVGTVSISKGKNSTIKFSGFGITSADVPSGATVANVTATVVFKVDDAGDPVTASVQMFDGSTAIGTAASATYNNNNAPTDLTSLKQTASSGVTPAMLTDASGFQVAVSFNNLSSGKGVTIAASIDYVQINVTWSNGATAATTSLGGFHFDNVIPADATINSLTTEVKWNVASSAPGASLAFQAYDNGGQTAIASASSTVTNPPTTATVATATVTNPGLKGSDLGDANFRVLLTATRNSGASFTAAVDYVKVSAAYTSTTSTNAVLYGGFGFNLPANATVTKITTETKWFASKAVATSVLGAQTYIGGGATTLGSELVSSPAPTTASVQSISQSNPPISPSDLSDTNFKVRVRVTR